MSAEDFEADGYDLVSSDMLLLRGPSEEQYRSNCQELQRLRSLHNSSEKMLIETTATAAADRAAVQCAETIVKQLTSRKFPHAESELENIQRDLQNNQVHFRSVKPVIFYLITISR